MNNCDVLKNLFITLKILKDIDSNQVEISQSSTHSKADYQTNIALKTFRLKRQKLNLKKPIEYAELIVKEFKDYNHSIIQDITCSIPGFINIKLTDKFLLDRAVLEKHEISDKPLTILDYSSPNIAKEMHVGHLRSTIIGDVISNILEEFGENVTRINHIGDWGTQFGMLIQYIMNNNIDINDSNISLSNLHVWYKDSKKIFDKDTDFNLESHKRVVELQSGEDKCVRIWKKLCEISQSSYNNIYNRLGISSELKIMGESFYNKYLDSVVNELEEKGLIIEENGAKLMFPIEGKIPLIVKKSDGGYGYDTTDLAAIRYRTQVLKAKKIIYVTDSGQSLHFELIFAAAKKCGWANDVILKHVGFGIVLGEDGKRIKSRSGESVRLSELISEADSKFYDSNLKRLKSENCQINVHDLSELSKIIGSSAIKYADLKQNRINNYQFSYEKMLDHKGDTIIYQLYSWVRISNIFKKTKKSVGNLKIINELDRDIILHLTQYNEVIKQASDTLLPNLICEYLFKLSTKINEYWNSYKILDSQDEESILALLDLTKRYMEYCYNILGIDASKVKNL